MEGTDGSDSVGRHLTFVLVEFFNVGLAVEAADISNNVKSSLGRMNPFIAVVGGGVGWAEMGGLGWAVV